ncbi:sensor histidine kinase [Rhizobium sp. SEMIA4064]|nr:HAMP domain-containing sensor histidine kinase [Rhizobium paranaense]PST64031.1 sensor histidine kinase [Rhizobium sp. SEMIA4064]
MFYAMAALIVAAFVLWFIVAAVVRQQVDQRLDLQIDAVRSTLVLGPDGVFGLSGNLDGPPFDRTGSGWYWQVTADGRHLSSRSLDGGSIASPPRALDWKRLFMGKPQPAVGSGDNGEALYFRVARTFVSGKAVEILASAPKVALTAPAARALALLVPAMLALGAILGVGILFQVRYGLLPLRALSGQISEISSGRLRELPQTEVDELRPVIGEINRLVEHNRKRLAETRLQFANLAHGLKTPVASLYLALDGKNDPTGEARHLVGRIDRRIRHHLGRARAGVSEAGLASSTDLRSRVDDIVQMMSKLYAERRLSVVTTVGSDLRISCSAEDTDEVLGGIIDNAFKWAASSVRITSTAEGAMVLISIEDDGPGIEQSRIAEAMKPGVRLDETVAGDGFGLSIAKEVAELYGGYVKLQARPENGLIAVVALPDAHARDFARSS